MPSCLRYFNPVVRILPYHIGEIPIGQTGNLVPAITQTAIGKLPQMKVMVMIILQQMEVA